MSTRGIRYLDERKIPYEMRRYEHGEKGAVFASRALDFPLEATIKTLVLELDPGGPVLLLMPGDREAPLKVLAKNVGARRAAMADMATAQRLTGYLVGGISPFGVRKQFPVYIDESLLDKERVAINAGQRGIMLIMSPRDIVAAVNAKQVRLD